MFVNVQQMSFLHRKAMGNMSYVVVYVVYYILCVSLQETQVLQEVDQKKAKVPPTGVSLILVSIFPYLSVCLSSSSFLYFL